MTYAQASNLVDACRASLAFANSAYNGPICFARRTRKVEPLSILAVALTIKAILAHIHIVSYVPGSTWNNVGMPVVVWKLVLTEEWNANL